MAIGIQTGGGGEFRQRISYNAKSGRLMRVDRSQNAAGEWQSSETDITSTGKFVMDIPNMKVGWIYFSATGPQTALAPLGHPIPAKPAAPAGETASQFKAGFQVLVALHSSCTDGTEPVREFMANSQTLLTVIDALHDQYLAAAESGQGKLPVVALTSTQPVKSKHGTNYTPVFEIVAWVDRPPSLAADAAPAATQAVAPPAAPVSPPPAPVPQPATVSASDFG
jgi:hypothetical protein